MKHSWMGALAAATIVLTVLAARQGEMNKSQAAADKQAQELILISSSGSGEEIRKAALTALGNKSETEMEVTIEFNDGKYARGKIKGNQLERNFYAQNVGKKWEIAILSDGVVKCRQLKKYADYPSNLIGECLDEESGKMLLR